jgi:hypothetical protein
VDYFVTREFEVGAWEPLGVVRIDAAEQIGISIARLSWRSLPGVFRLVELDGPDWFEVEVAADGVVVEP